MSAAVTLTSYHNLHSGSSDAALSYTNTYTQEHNYSTALLSTSATSETEVLQHNYEPSMDSTLHSFAFVNGGYSSPIESRKTQAASVFPELEKTEDKENVINCMDTSSGGFVCPYAASSNSQFNDNVSKQSAPLSMRPQIHVRLMRAKSPSNEPIINDDNSWQVEETAEPTSLNPDEEDITRIATTPFLSHKPGWYLHKVGAFFKRKVSKSLNNLTCQSTDDLSGHDSTKCQIATISKSQSYTSILDVPEPRAERLTKLQIKEKMRAIHKYLREGATNEVGEFKSSEDVHNRLDRSMNTDDKSNTKVFPSWGQVKVHTPEPNDSLVRHHSELNDSWHVNFTRIPSLRRGKSHLVMHQQLTTSFTPQADGEVQVIKDATHVQPLENGDVIVTDILGNIMVLFGSDGYPKITFSFETGSEPCATCLTPEGCLAVTLKRQGCVALWSTSGEPVTEFGHTVLSGPTGIQCDRHGRFIVADEQANSVFIFSNEGQLLTKLAPPTLDTAAQGSSSPLSQIQTSSFLNSYHNSFNQPRYVCLTHTGNYVISDSANHCIKIFDQDMQLSSQFGSYGQRDGCFKFPYGVASDAEGNLYVADHFNNRVSMFSGEGEFIQHLLTLQDGIARPKSIAVCRSLLYVTHGDIRSNKVSVFALKS